MKQTTHTREHINMCPLSYLTNLSSSSVPQNPLGYLLCRPCFSVLFLCFWMSCNLPGSVLSLLVDAVESPVQCMRPFRARWQCEWLTYTLFGFC